MSYSLNLLVLVSPLVTRIIVPYLIPYIYPLKEYFYYSAYYGIPRFLFFWGV